jgi:hypothetical protein
MWSPLLSSFPSGIYFQGEHTENISQSHHFVKQKKHKVVTFLSRSHCGLLPKSRVRKRKKQEPCSTHSSIAGLPTPSAPLAIHPLLYREILAAPELVLLWEVRMKAAQALGKLDHPLLEAILGQLLLNRVTCHCHVCRARMELYLKVSSCHHFSSQPARNTSCDSREMEGSLLFRQGRNDLTWPLSAVLCGQRAQPTRRYFSPAGHLLR